MRHWAILATLLLVCAVWTPDGARASSSKKEEATGPQGPQTVMVEGLSVPVVRRRQVEGHVMVVIALEPVDLAAQHKIEAAMPRLRDAYISDLYAYFGAVGYDGSASALQAVIQRLTRATEKTLGPGVAKSVLLQGASNNPMS
jgi:hypothetical protein